MSKVFRRQYAEPGGGVIEDDLGYRVFAFNPQAPVASDVGFSAGCIYVNTTKPPVLGTIVYVNTGDETSATWTNIL